MDHQPTVFIVDDDQAARRSLSDLVESMRLPFQAFASANEFLAAFDPSRPGCLLLGVQMPGDSGLELLERLGREKIRPPVICLSAHADVATVVGAMKAGVLDFLEKPWQDPQLREAVQEALSHDAENRRHCQRIARIQRRIAQLTSGERDVLKMLVEGKSNKTMAQRLELSVRAIEVRRAKVMEKMKAGSLAELVRLTLVAGSSFGRPQGLLGRIP